MEKLVFDRGVKTFQVNDNGVLRFNPSDPNVYARFMEAAEKIQTVEKNLVSKAQAIQDASSDVAAGEMVLRMMSDADREAKQILSWCFGGDNDFNEILEGVNLLAVGSNGERVITNFINALLPIIEEGAKRCAEEQVGAAVAEAKLNREQRRAQQ